VKFLAWQFGLYALAAFNLGALVAHLWWQPRHHAARRSARARGSQIETLSHELAEEQAARARERAVVAQVPSLTQDLAATKQALAFAQVELEASSARRLQVQKTADDLKSQLDRHRFSGASAERLEGEVNALRTELDEARVTGVSDRADAEERMARLAAALRNADEARIALHRRHDAFVLQSQRDLSAMTVRAETAERRASGTGPAENPSGLAAMSSGGDAKRDTQHVEPENDESTSLMTAPSGAIIDMDGPVIDLRFIAD
jgi:hypothetical protein